MGKKQLTAREHFIKGQGFLSKDKDDEAISEFDKAIAKDTEKKLFYVSFYHRGMAYEEKGDLDRAIADYTIAVNECPQMYLIRYVRGNACFKNGDYKRAIEDFTVVFENNRFFYEGIRDRCRAYHLNNDFERAIEDYTIFLMEYPGIRKDKTIQRLNEALARVAPNSPAAICAKKQLSVNEAREEFYEANGKDKEWPLDYISSGSVHETRREFDEAITAYTSALDDCPEHYLVKFLRGNVYLKKGDYDPAIADFNAVLEISPRFPEVLSRRGRAYHLKNEFERAIEDYTAYITLCPESWKVKGMLQDALAYKTDGDEK